ncbi:MAG TPA: universal stress protein [Nitrospira sp.]|nr:universal stress protein [Nitrospira sp.]
MPRPIVTRILLATDFSDSAERAQEYGQYLAASFGVPLDIVHIVEVPPEAEDAGDERKPLAAVETDVRDRLTALREHLHGLPGAIHVGQAKGQPSGQIRRIVQETGADLLVMGLQGQGRRPYGLIGTTAERVTAEGPCPVLTVPLPQTEAAPCTLRESSKVEVQRVLAPIDESDPSLDALEYAMQFACGLDAGLVLLHVLEESQDHRGGISLDDEAGQRVHWDNRLAEFASVGTALGLAVDQEVRTGLPSDSILAGALHHGCDLIVMGTHGRGARVRVPFGSVARAILRQATCPALTVKSPKFVTGLRRQLPPVFRTFEPP